MEVQRENIDALIVVRDLDGLRNDQHQLALRKEFFRKVNASVNFSTRSSRRVDAPSRPRNFVRLLFIYELEVLFLADPQPFEEYFEVRLPRIPEPETVVEPKELLRTATYQGAEIYAEHHARHLLPKLDFNLLIEQLPSFTRFIKDLEAILKE